MIVAALLDLVRWAYTGNGYNILSGPVPDATLLGGLGMLYRRHSCHVQGCWRLAWHPHPTGGHPVCRPHHPHGDVDWRT